MDSSARFSLAPLAALARAISTRPGTTQGFDNLLATLQAADRELDAETRQLRRSLECTREQLAIAEKAGAVAERERDEARSEIEALKELVAARENAHVAQENLVKQLKIDNEKLRQSYAAAVRRAGDSSSIVKLAHVDTVQNNDRSNGEEERGGVRDRRVSVVVGGSRKDMRFSDAELVHVFQENERLEVAGQELIIQVEQQKDAHEKLRDTIAELMTQLQEGTREREERDVVASKTMTALKHELSNVSSECARKDVVTSNLQRQLNKVQAEFHAISVAHSYSNAELAKLRVATRANKKSDRERHMPGGFSGAVLGGVENLLHHRRNNVH